MAYTAAYTSRTVVRSKRRSATPKSRVSAGREASKVRRVAKAKSGVSRMQRRGKKTLRAELLKSKNAVAKGRALAARKKRVIARGKAGVAASALNEKRRKAQAKYGVGAKSRAKAVSGRAPARGVASRRVSRRRRAAPRLLRCSACGGVVPWVSVDRRCFPCLKRGIAARKREDEFALGVFEIEEEFVPAVQ